MEHRLGGEFKVRKAPFALSCTVCSSAVWLSPLLGRCEKALHTGKRIGMDAGQTFSTETGPGAARTCLHAK